MTLAPERPTIERPTEGRLVDQFEFGLDAPICLTWELTYACNLSCVHCLSSSGRRDPDELSTDEAKALIDEFERMKIFYVNIGGGEPTVRPDFWELLDYAVDHHVGVKFSTNGFRITPERAARLAATDYVDVQISLDGATADVNDPVRGEGTYDAAMRALGNLQAAGMKDFKISVVCTRHNIPQLDEFKAIADHYGAQLRLTRLRPSGRGADVWGDLHPLPEQQRQLYDWLVANGEQVLTGDSFFHLSAYATEDGTDALPGLNLCGAGRVVCLVDPVGDVYACPFAIHDRFKAGNVRSQAVPGGTDFDTVWKHSDLFTELRSPQSGGACTSCSAYDSCRGGCMAAKFFTGLPLDGPDPECVKGNGEAGLAAAGALPSSSQDHSHKGPVRNQPVPLTLLRSRPDKACEESPLAGFVPGAG
jgi:mycofactocin radical SAM maturase